MTTGATSRHGPAVPSPATGGVLLVGSVPLHDAVEVFRRLGSALGDRIERIPDGETGGRGDWIGWQYPVIAACPALDVAGSGGESYRSLPQLRLRPGAAAADIEFGDLGYAREALRSYSHFARLKRDGAIPPACRFSVALPTPLAPVTAFVSRPDRGAVEPRYEARLLGEVRAITDAIPHDELALQWDTNLEFAILDGLIDSHLADPRAGIVERLAWLAGAVPPGVELGYHFCHDHERIGHVRPYNARNLVGVASELFDRVDRAIDWVHLPVQGDRVDVDYLERLAALALRPGTRVYLGLINPDEGVAGASARVVAAQRYIRDFGVATACGWGRLPGGDVDGLIALHRAVTAPLDSTINA